MSPSTKQNSMQISSAKKTSRASCAQNLKNGLLNQPGRQISAKYQLYPTNAGD